jgi:CheY-like chemotaxis protein
MAKTRLLMQAGFMPVRCLIVDDSQVFLRAASNLLEREGLSVVGVASTGAQAYRAYTELKPEVVLLDIELGEETGFEVARQLAGLADSEQPRVILVSSYSADDFEDMIADSPAVSFLPKGSLSGTAIRGILARASGSVTQKPQRESR